MLQPTTHPTTTLWCRAIRCGSSPSISLRCSALGERPILLWVSEIGISVGLRPTITTTVRGGDTLTTRGGIGIGESAITPIIVGGDMAGVPRGTIPIGVGDLDTIRRITA